MGAPSNTFISATLTGIKTDTPYLALYTTNPTAADTGTEVTAYTRQAITFGTVTATGGAGSMANSADITFTDIPTANVTHYAIRNASSAGTMKVFGSLSSTAGIVTGDELKFPTGALTVSFGA